MGTGVITVVSPVGIRKPTQLHEVSYKSTGDQLSLGLLSNGKPNIGLLERDLADMLIGAQAVNRVEFYEKRQAGVPAQPELIHKIVSECFAIINGSAD